MTIIGTDVDDRNEGCDNCGRQTPHMISVEVLTESANSENAQYSREPYRISECDVCGAIDRVRMSTA